MVLRVDSKRATATVTVMEIMIYLQWVTISLTRSVTNSLMMTTMSKVTDFSLFPQIEINVKLNQKQEDLLVLSSAVEAGR